VISYDWDQDARKASVTIEQSQTGENVAPIFQLPLQVDIYDASGAKTRQQIVVTKRNQTFTFAAAAKPALINVDAGKSLLCVKEDRHTPEEWAFMFKHAPLFRDRWEALEALQQEESQMAKDVVTAALNDKFWAIRERALEMADITDPTQLSRVAAMAENDQEPSTRSTAIAKLSETEDAQYTKLYEKGLASDQPYSVVTQALSALGAVDPAAAAIAAQNLKSDDSEGLVVPLAELFAEKPDRANLDFYQKNASKIDYLGAFAFFDAYQRYLVGLNDQGLTDAGVLSWKDIALNTETSQWRRFSATKAIADVRNTLRENNQSAKAEEYTAMLTEIKAKEKDETLKMYYDMF
jgi:aminopeptidase N